jgi:hypothetical protein
VDAKELQSMKSKLLSERERLEGDLASLEESTAATSKDSSGDLSSYSSHMADQGTDSMEREKAFLFAAVKRRRMEEIDWPGTHRSRHVRGVRGVRPADSAQAARARAGRQPVRVVQGKGRESAGLELLMFYFVCVAVVLADQLAKWFVVHHMHNGPLLGDLLRLTLTQNTGAAFGLFPGARAPFIVISIIAAIGLAYANAVLRPAMRGASGWRSSSVAISAISSIACGSVT